MPQSRPPGKPTRAAEVLRQAEAAREGEGAYGAAQGGVAGGVMDEEEQVAPPAA